MKTGPIPAEQYRNPSMGKTIWAVSFLILSTWILNEIGSYLLDKFARYGTRSYWPGVFVDQTLLIAMACVSVQLIVVLYFCRPIKALFIHLSEGRSENWTLKDLVAGLVGGVCAFLVSIPLLLWGFQIHPITQQLMHWPVSLAQVSQVGMYLVVVPVLNEMVFRGVIFRGLLDASSLWPAAIGSSLLFAYVWAAPNTTVAFILGITSALVFKKTGTLAGSILANITLTLLIGSFLLAHDLHFF